MKAGPKSAVDPSPLPFRNRGSGSETFAAFCAKYVVVPSGKGARRPLRLRHWQTELVSSVLDPDPRPRLAGWMLPRGQGKSTLVAAMALHELMLGGESASVVVAAVDERQARIVFGTASRMIELSEPLSDRVQVFADRLVVPERGASLMCLPAEAKRLEGLNFTLAVLDEFGVASRDVHEALALAQGKREQSTLLGIGTPGPSPDSVLADMRDYAAQFPDDRSLVWREFSAAEFIGHPVDCRHCSQLANPALGDFLHEDALTALLPPKMREATYRRSRLCQFVTEAEGAWLPVGAWAACADPGAIPDGADVVLALDGSFSQDCTALVAATISPTPHIDVAALWEPPASDPEYRVPVADVEQAIRDACRRWNVREVTADPYRWTRTLQALEAERLPITEFPQSPQRMTPATTGAYEAVVNHQVTHSGDERLARHIGNATIREDSRGTRLAKEHKNSKRRIDLAVCYVMAHARATNHAHRKPIRKRTRSFKL